MSNVDEALELMGLQDFQLVLSDIMMPGRNGIELLEEISEGYPDTAVIMVTAVADMATAIRALKTGAYDYVTKPFNMDEVEISIQRAFEKRRLLIANREYRDHLEQKVAEQTESIRQAFMGAVASLVEALEAKDAYTKGHSSRVTEIAVILAGESGMSDSEVEKIKLAGTVHDLGKIGVPDSILNKPGKLTDEEFSEIKKHCATGERILKAVILDSEVLAIVRHHHERFGGGGYLDAISGEEIPLGSRILAVADAYDAMTSDRPYRDALPVARAISELKEYRGSQFDPGIVGLFLKVHDKLVYCPLDAHSEIA